MEDLYKIGKLYIVEDAEPIELYSHEDWSRHDRITIIPNGELVLIIANSTNPLFTCSAKGSVDGNIKAYQKKVLYKSQVGWVTFAYYDKKTIFMF